MKNIVQQTLFLSCKVLFRLVFFFLLSCASISPDLVKQEDGFYYGYGTASSKKEAAVLAKRDLISNALTTMLKTMDKEAGRIEISIESAKKINLKLKPLAEKKEGAITSITYRIKKVEWDKFETTRENMLRDDIRSQLRGLTNKQPLVARIKQAFSLLDRLTNEGVSEFLTMGANDTRLIAHEIENIIINETEGLKIDCSPKEGFINNETAFFVRALDDSGKVIENLYLKVKWLAQDTEPIIQLLKTNSIGNVKIGYPEREAFRNRSVELLVTTNFSSQVNSLSFIKDLNKKFACKKRYQHFQDAFKFYTTGIKVPAGKFTAGALAKDNRASKKEVVRTVTTFEYYIDICPVTNAEYAIYLHTTSAESFPEYWDNSLYNQPDQPVVGVSQKDAERYAEWLSDQLGMVYRLPTEDEWEKAARAGQDVIYPWGDESPASGEKANYYGNKRFKGPSPVGAFEAGKNAWGLLDMAGNVWQWTSTSHSEEKERQKETVTVKGGSWMDGPVELRISNRRDLNPNKGYVDVGFRLIREATK